VKPGQGELFADAAALPQGFIYRADFIAPEEERELLAGVQALPLEEARYKEYTAKRRVASFGLDYDFSSNALGEAPALPDFLLPLRDKVATWLEVAPQELKHALVAEYRAGTPLGWHRDAPDFERVVGVSVGGWARMRLRRYPPDKSPVLNVDLAPCSAYLMQGVARWRWQHSIPATKALRYSITFRTLRAA
jgi:alkylated DNA repair dioxygenase AlkB